MIGMEILKPKTVVVISILLTSIRILGRKLSKTFHKVSYISNHISCETSNKKVKYYLKEKKAYRILAKAFLFS